MNAMASRSPPVWLREGSLPAMSSQASKAGGSRCTHSSGRNPPAGVMSYSAHILSTSDALRHFFASWRRIVAVRHLQAAYAEAANAAPSARRPAPAPEAMPRPPP
eukprot:CAMPEP_0174940458 /NCGR_PEP_ID=MMETSP1355-20121228/69195_1 /TAXON_ID=464990 /ORGANISM="Hemiselmis tepida, Strain CCMP443" /LENGTH=104 /DNA_ID=CAMNT_0016187511 /DNA_START=20 /DNA_END=331 /DNA_ORIENTATION=-